MEVKASTQAAAKSGFAKNVPGIGLAICIALVSLYLSKYVPLINDVIFAIVIGALVKNSVGVSGQLQPGLNYCLKKLLKLAIVLLGLQLSFLQVIKTGGQALAIIVICVAVAMTLTYYIGKKLGLSDTLATLIGMGTAICGATAIVATGPVIEAEEQDISLAVATIFVFNTIALFVYPLLGHFLSLSDAAFGAWVGTAVHDTSSVVATGFAYSNQAGAIATVVKLTRTVLLVPLVFIVGIIYNNKKQDRTPGEARSISYSQMFPWFVLGFLGIALLNTVGVFPKEFTGFFTPVTKFLILMVMAAIGLGLDIAKMRRIGLTFLYAGLFASVIMAVFSLSLIYMFKIG